MDLKTDKDDILILPEGYRWCANCEALTPHDKKSSKKFAWDSDFVCQICGYDKTPFSDECVHCGYDAEALLEEWGIHEVPVHEEGCSVPIAEKEWEEKQKIEQDLMTPVWKPFPYPDIKCDCPKVTIFQKPNIFDVWSRTGDTMTCMNALEWGCRWRCPVCGTINEHETGNC